MVHLKFYSTERIIFRNMFELRLTDSEILKISKKLLHHFKFNCYVYFRGNRQSGCAWINRLRIGHNSNLGLLVHELSHVFNFQKFHNRGHNKKLLATMKKFFKYCLKMKLWRK